MLCVRHKATMLKQAYGENFKLVTPGIRTADASADESKRIMTPERAVEAGSDYLVIGRAITKSDNPIQTMKDIYASLNS